MYNLRLSRPQSTIMRHASCAMEGMEQRGRCAQQVRRDLDAQDCHWPNMSPVHLNRTNGAYGVLHAPEARSPSAPKPNRPGDGSSNNAPCVMPRSPHH